MRASILLAIVLSGCDAAGPLLPATDDMRTGATDGPTTTLDVEGRIVGLDQRPLPGVAVSLCQQTCRETTTGAQGEFAFPGAETAQYALHARLPDAADYAALHFPLYLLPGANPRLLPLVLPRVGAGAVVPGGPAAFPVDGALTLSIDGTRLALPSGGRVGLVGGVRIPQDLQPNFCVPSAKVLAMWAFAPTGVTSTAPVGVTISDALGLPPGAEVQLIEIDPKDGRPAVTASGAVSQDGRTIQTAPGVGLRGLGWLLVVVLQGGA